MARIAIVGAGVMGLAAGYHAAKAGHKVEIFEADTIPGGMAAHFDFGGVSIERFYHFICKSDLPTFELMQDLGIGDRMRWVNTKMGYYIDGKHHQWGDPISLLRFPLMGFWQKFRYGLSAFWVTKQKNFDHLEHMNAKDWIIRSFGAKIYDLMWKRLLELKFFEYTTNISAAWIATRIKRIGNSRKSIMQESLGYIDGGSQTLVDALIENIEAMDGKIHLGSPVEKITSQNGNVCSLKINGELSNFDQVISTSPTPLISKMVPGLSESEKAAYDAIENIGCVCVLVKLKQAVTENFWLNINDQKIEIPGIIEFSNLRSFDDHIVYVPYYMPVTHYKFTKDDNYFVDEVKHYLKQLNANLNDEDFIDIKVGRLRHSQPICDPGFASKIPPIQTSISGLQIADTCFYYPEDRGISESVRLAKEMASHLK